MAKYQRPSGAYAGVAGLANSSKYQDDGAAVPKRAISSSKMDGDLNYLVDAVNETWTTLSSAGFAAALPDQAGHTGQIPVTNGSTTGWQFLTNGNVAERTLGLDKLALVAAGSVVGADSDGVAAALGVGNGLAVQSGNLVNTQAFPPTGMLTPFAGGTAPTGWLFAAGQTVSRVTYNALYLLLGTTYGVGDGATTFNLPDMRGRVALGLDNIGGTDAGRLSVDNTLGGSGGSQTKSGTTDGHALTVAEMPSHNHTFQSANNVAGGGGGHDVVASGGTTVSSGINSLGGGGAHSHTLTGLDVLPPYLLLNWIIKV